MTRYKCKALRKTVKTRDLIIMTPPKNRHSTKFNVLKIKPETRPASVVFNTQSKIVAIGFTGKKNANVAGAIIVITPFTKPITAPPIGPYIQAAITITIKTKLILTTPVGI